MLSSECITLPSVGLQLEQIQQLASGVSEDAHACLDSAGSVSRSMIDMR